MIGSEGTLGVITKINMLCIPKEKYKEIVFVRLPNYQEVLKLVKVATKNLGRNLTALEWLDLKTFNATVNNCDGIVDPF